ncbi:hypothetical protein [Flammeovirga kamogawensis]|uniref:Anti-sigma factor n=1 Tax=Flammeovirga kamogawensis TaxID=373891 RepID=A0ABX8GZH4_9BACT|nr:hypothetical protein [Flammeovirga kamogawensis]MBB6459395.1 anti-sigma-K factor RskA [Flammeovirga kamogawensis]QWG08951.1 hypothetical protein KM029_08400 [Flammeovirga kamogawensis]TRX67241.1 hypothetical protein EO216_03445 [Flammeovirga kamogawensis]
MENNELTTYIDAYLEGTLSVEEKEAFDNRRKDDETFEKEVLAQIHLIEIVKRNEFVKKLKAFEESNYPNKTNLIDAYLSNDLTPELSAYVENKLKEDEDFKFEVKAQEQIVAKVRREALKEQLTQFENKHEGSTKEAVPVQTTFKVEKPQEKEEVKEVSFRVFNPKIIAVAASVCIFILATVVFFKNDVSTSSPVVINSYSIEVKSDTESLGFAGDNDPNITIEIVQDESKKGYYNLQGKKLQLFVGKDSKDFPKAKLSFDPVSTPSFLLYFNDRDYLIDYTETPQPLK